jgi:hypothetical protein
MAAKRTIVEVPCSVCGGGFRKHEVMGQYTQKWPDNPGEIDGIHVYQIVRCRGCDIVRFRIHSESEENRDQETGQLEPFDIVIFPDPNEGKKTGRGPESFGDAAETLVPVVVLKMYQETIACLNAGANTLAGGGLRATVEAICQEQKVTGATLKARIDNLVTNGVLAKAQADFLHEERSIGNEALHQMKTPSEEDIEDGLKIVEGMLNTIYVLPSHAARLKGKRAATTPVTLTSSPTKKTTK